MRNLEENYCDFLLLYVAGDGTDTERMKFERHLSTCSSCMAELQETAEVWNAIPLLIEETDAPRDLKAEVLGGIFGNDPAKETEESTREFLPVKQFRSRWIQHRIALIGSAAVLILATGYLLFSATGPGEKKQITTAAVLPPSQVLKTYTLNAVDSSMPTASGTAWVLQGEEKNQVVVQLKGLSKTNGNEAYQVWLIHDGKRYNCGTLLADADGTGVLTYLIKKESVFDAIGVTLEPDAKGTQPRGKKVLGT
ncbi:anti-sigma factor [Paenibacillus sp. RC67]|uniref:anti-sigma factor n=1 Tax=Paenibacillus sp. RC67 TaxID=3039392 RepID=UPI0024AD6EA8|nr:anti-sigma factor [Paenibacillus sp. RC67]